MSAETCRGCPACLGLPAYQMAAADAAAGIRGPLADTCCAISRVAAERDALQAEVERLRAERERIADENWRNYEIGQQRLTAAAEARRAAEATAQTLRERLGEALRIVGEEYHNNRSCPCSVCRAHRVLCDECYGESRARATTPAQPTEGVDGR